MKTVRINFFPWNSLRIHDQPILAFRLSEKAEYVVNVALVPQSITLKHIHNQPRYSHLQQSFLNESLHDLKANLLKNGSNLLLVKNLPQFIKMLAQKYKIVAIVTQRQYTSEEIAIVAQCTNANTPIHLVDGLTMVIPDRIKPVPSNFTQFRKQVESYSSRSYFRASVCMPNILGELGRFPPLEDGIVDLELQSQIDPKVRTNHPDSAFPFFGGESAALERLEDYTFRSKHVATYKETRNGLIGSEYSTKLSPYLAFGCVSPVRVMQRVREFEKTVVKNESTYWVFFELLWRDYFILMARDFGIKLFQRSGFKDVHLKWVNDAGKFAKWCSGNTGVPFVDANMRELLATGFMSNRGRQNVASFLTKDLCIDWILGAEHFESLLLDYDPASNYGNWQYQAGVGTDPRESRYFNVVKQGRDYDPDGEYILKWCPELKRVPRNKIFAPWTVSPMLTSEYPRPIVVSPQWKKHCK